VISPSYTGRVTLTGWAGRALHVIGWQGEAAAPWQGRTNRTTHAGRVTGNSWTGRTR
jgi:hypothetical protein